MTGTTSSRPIAGLLDDDPNRQGPGELAVEAVGARSASADAAYRSLCGIQPPFQRAPGEPPRRTKSVYGRQVPGAPL